MKRSRIFLASVTALLLLLLLMIFTPVGRVVAQTLGYRWAGGQLITSGPGAGIYTEPGYNLGPDVGFARLGIGQLGQVNGGINFNPEAVLTPPPVISMSNSASAGSIPAGVIRGVLIYVTPTGGLTNVAAAGEATTTTSGGASSITATAPIAAAGAAGYTVGLSPVGGATLTENLQPMSTAVCAGAFAVQSGLVVCPFGVNAVMTTLATSPGVPLQNSAAYPEAVPQLVCNLAPQPSNTTVTTIQAMGSCILAPGIQNVTGKVMRITGHGIYTSAAQTGTATVSITEGGVTPMTVTSAAIVTGGQTNAQFYFDYYLTTSLTGASGTLEGHGQLCWQIATAANGTALPCYNDTITAASSAINLTSANTLAINITMSSSTTSVTLRDAQVWLLN